MKTEKAKTVEIELTTGQAFGCFMALRPFSDQSLPVRAALKVRRMHRDLQPHAQERQELEQKLLEDFGGTANDDGSVEWEKEEGAAEFATLCGETVTVEIAPLTFDELDGDGITVMPAALMQLEDCGLLIED